MTRIRAGYEKREPQLAAVQANTALALDGRLTQTREIMLGAYKDLLSVLTEDKWRSTSTFFSAGN